MKKTRWFNAWGWVYRPISWQGWLILGLGVVFCAQVFLAVDRNSHSASDTLYGFFPYLVSTLTLLYWVAAKTSKVE